MAKSTKTKRSSRKVGRSKSWCQAYRAACRTLINKKRKIRRHLRCYPADTQAQKALDRIT